MVRWLLWADHDTEGVKMALKCRQVRTAGSSRLLKVTEQEGGRLDGPPKKNLTGLTPKVNLHLPPQLVTASRTRCRSPAESARMATSSAWSRHTNLFTRRLKRSGDEAPLSDARVHPCVRLGVTDPHLRDGTCQKIGDRAPPAASHANLSKADERGFNPSSFERRSDVNKGAESVGFLPKSQSVDQAVHKRIGSPSETTLSLVKAREEVRRNASMHEVFEHLESARGQRDRSAVVWTYAISVFEEWSNLAGLPCWENGSPCEHDVVEVQQKKAPPPIQSGLEDGKRDTTATCARIRALAESPNEIRLGEKSVELACGLVSTTCTKLITDRSGENGLKIRSSARRDLQNCSLHWAQSSGEGRHVPDGAELEPHSIDSRGTRRCPG